jgi:serine/threonine-protein kinase
MSPGDSMTGRTVGGKWRIERTLGLGGMGTVYLATDLSVDRPVALKFLLPSLAAETEYRARFEQEARVMAKVDHPNLVTLYGVERDGEVPFLVMKYVTGQTLAEVIKTRGRVALSEAMPLMRQMASALMTLHAQGYVHRDLKPGNIMVSDDGHVTLLDFGLIRTHQARLTRPGVAVGSPMYMSPEQAIAGTVDARSDLYTLAVVCTELVTGRRPFVESEVQAMLLAHLEKPPIPPHELDGGVPEAVSVVLLQAMSKKPNERQQTIAQFWAELSEAISVSATVVGTRSRAKKGSGKHVVPENGHELLHRAGPERNEAARRPNDGGVPMTAAEASKRVNAETTPPANAPVVGATEPAQRIAAVATPLVVGTPNALVPEVDATSVGAPVASDEPLESQQTFVPGRQRRLPEPMVDQTETAVPATGGALVRPNARTIIEVAGPAAPDSARTVVGLAHIAQPTVSALSEVSSQPPAVSTSDANPVVSEPQTDPNAAIVSTATNDALDPTIARSHTVRLPNLEGPEEGLPSWVYLLIGGGSVLLLAFLGWLLFW